LGAAVSGPAIRVTSSQATLSDGTSQVYFGTPSPGAPLAQSLQVCTAGPANLTLGTITLPTGFSLASGFGATTLAPSASTSFSARSEERRVGKESRSRSSASNDTKNPNFMFTVLGATSTVRVLDDGGQGFV